MGSRFDFLAKKFHELYRCAWPGSCNYVSSELVRELNKLKDNGSLPEEILFFAQIAVIARFPDNRAVKLDDDRGLQTKKMRTNVLDPNHAGGRRDPPISACSFSYTLRATTPV